MNDSLTNENRLKPWNITQLAKELHNDLSQCQNAFERSNCSGIYTREMRELRDAKLQAGEKFHPGEIAVMQEHGLI